MHTQNQIPERERSGPTDSQDQQITEPQGQQFYRMHHAYLTARLLSVHLLLVPCSSHQDPRVRLAGRHKGGIHRAQELGHEGYHEMGKKGGLASSGEDPEQRAQREGIQIDESKFRKS